MRPEGNAVPTRLCGYFRCSPPQQGASLREAPLERIGRAHACHDLSRKATPVTGGTTEGQALLQHPDGVFQVSLGEVQGTEAAVNNDRCEAAACQRGEAECLLPV